MQLYQAGLIDQIELLKQTDVADMEGARKIWTNETITTAVANADEEIKKLKGDLQTAQGNHHDRKRVEVKEFEKKLAKAEAKIEMAQKLYQSETSDELKNAKNDLSMAAEDNPQREIDEAYSINEEN